MTFRAPLPLLAFAVSAYLAGCSNTPPTAQAPSKPVSTKAPAQTPSQTASVVPPYKGGGYYKDDGPGLNPPDNLDDVPDAQPRAEPLHNFANNPYKVLGKTYTPMLSNKGYKKDGMASWYGRKFHGKATSSGEPYDMYAMTAAHPTLPIPSYARVTNGETGKSIVVRINDRGPFHDNRLIDLSYTAAHKLDVLKGVTPVTVEAMLPGDPATEPATLAGAPSVNPEPQPVPASPAAPEPLPGPAYYLQLGAFASQERANELLNRVTARLSRTFPGVLRMAVDGLYKVQAGPFASAEEADQAAGLLRDEMGLKSFKVMSDRRAAQPELTAALRGASDLYLQLAALSSAAAADSLGSQIRSRYGAELPGIARVQSGTLYTVQAGPFASPAAAQRISLAYQQDFGVKPHPVLR